MQYKKGSDVLTYTVFYLLGIFVILFILFPILKLITLPSFKLILEALKDRSTIISIWNSISLSFITAMLSLLFGVPLAFLMAKKKFSKLESVVETIVDLPLAIPHTVVGIALLFVIGREGIIGSLFYREFGFKITGTSIAIIIAMLFVSLPYLVDNAREGFKNVDPDLEKASTVLGASLFSTFARINLPLSMESIASGFLLTWARSISEFGAVVILAYYPMTAPVKIYDAFTQYNLAVSTAIAAVLLVICLSIFLILKVVIHKK